MEITIGDRKLSPTEVERMVPWLDVEAKKKWPYCMDQDQWEEGQKTLWRKILRAIDTHGIG